MTDPLSRPAERAAVPEPIWQPAAGRIAKANLTRFAEFARQTAGVRTSTYAELWEWSVTQPAEFWPAVWDFCEIRAATRGERVLIDGHRMPGARWFPEARLNYAENLLLHNDDSPALIFWNERGRQAAWSFRDLRDQTARLAATLRNWGLQPGDRVAALLPNHPAAIVILLAASSLGVIFSSCSPDFGVPGILDRFGQISPRVLFVTDGVEYAGKRFPLREKTVALLAELPSVEHVVQIPYLEPDERGQDSGCWTTWDAVLNSAAADLEFLPLPFDHPLMILFSSGTTGVPKCLVHGAGGTLLQHRKEHVLHTDLRAGDRLFYFTTTGWMMWNWLVTGLATGCTLILFDGSPVHPGPSILWDLAEAERLTVFGASAKYLSALEKSGVKPRLTHRLDELKTILSTGSPLLPESFDYVYRDVKADVCLSSISGGTDIVSCFALGNAALPVSRGELQCRGLGMNVDVFDEQGRPLVGRTGELVCKTPFPSMPVGFWNDPDGKKYRAAYFERYPDVWCHGDFTELTPRGTLIITGRSDAVLNPGGVRIGTAELYRQVDQIPEVLESIAVGQQWQGDVRIVLFVRLRDGLELTDSLRSRIIQQIRTGASPRHVPARMLQVQDLPRTRSGKITELAVADVVHGRPVVNVAALANPEALDQFRDRPELQD